MSPSHRSMCSCRAEEARMCPWKWSSFLQNTTGSWTLPIVPPWSFRKHSPQAWSRGTVCSVQPWHICSHVIPAPLQGTSKGTSWNGFQNIIERGFHKRSHCPAKHELGLSPYFFHAAVMVRDELSHSVPRMPFWYILSWPLLEHSSHAR